MRRSIVSIRTTAACVALASCLAAQTALAQYKPGQREPTTFGIVGGLNFASMSGSDATGTSARTTFHAGLGANMTLGGNIFFQPQVLYFMKGPKMEFSGVTATLKMGYVEVPLLLGMRIPMANSNIRPFIVAGPSIGIKMSCKIKASGGGTTAELNCDDSSVGMTVRSTDIGLAAGLGVELPMGSGRLQIFGRYSMGLSEPIQDSNVKNTVISVGAGYFFGGH
jgi:hypothetical protein